MNRNCPWKRSQELEIDLLELLLGFCKQWKKILLCALAAAVLAGGYGFFRNSRILDGLEMSEPAKTSLNREEQGVVEEAAELTGQVHELHEYLDNSILMQINPYRCSYAVSLYSIDEVTGANQTKIIESYLNFLNNGGVLDALKQYDKKTWGMERRYLGELISAWYKIDGANQLDIKNGADGVTAVPVLYVQVAGKDVNMAKRLSEDIQKVLKDYSVSVKKACGRHKLALVSSEESIKIDRNLQAQQDEKKSALKADTANLKAITDAFSREQWGAYEKISGVQKQDDEKQEDEMTITDHAYEAVTLKFLLLGFAGGIFVFFMIYTSWYVLHDTIKSPGEFQSYYTIPFYGSISFQENRKKKKGKLDICTKEAEKVLNRLKIVCEKKGISKIGLAADFVLDSHEQKCVQDMAAQLHEWGIEASIIENIHGDYAGWNMAAESGTILILCRTGTTTRRIIDEEMEVYLESGINVAGAVILENGKKTALKGSYNMGI